MKAFGFQRCIPFLATLASVVAQNRDSYTGYAGLRISVPNDANNPAIRGTSGEWTVPKLCVPSDGNGSNTYFVAAWVGFMGNGCSDTRGALVQAGVTMKLDPDGKTTASPWVEWYPKAAEFKDDIQVNAGDTVTFNIEVDDPTTGHVTISNNGESVVESFQSTDPSNPANNLCSGPGDVWAVIETTGAQPADPNILPGFADITFNSFEATGWGNQKYDINSKEAVLCDMDNAGQTFATTDRVLDTGFRIHSSKGSCSA
ncbi:concanavalin A-like lectin/glucanase [Daldinia sp. FL1419]|nr:concanavalin A-like lectin/glucanase [Daldinia sp. FL1419]